MIFISPQLTFTPSKIVSLVPSITELLSYLQLEEQTIGITKFCIHPENWFTTKVKVGGTKTLKIEKIKELNPDLIIANKEENIKEQIEELGEKFNVFLTDANNFSEALLLIRDIGIVTGKEESASALIEKIKSAVPHFNSPNIKVAYLIWQNPFMVAGGNTYINSMLSVCGLKNVFENQLRYPEISVDEINKSDAEYLLFSTEPYPFQQQHLIEYSSLFPGKKLLLADGEMFSWYGSRMLEAMYYFKNFRKEMK